MQWYLMVIDALESKLYREPPVKHKKKPPANICKVYFSNKAVELVSLLSIFRNTQLVSLLNNLKQPISSSIFNFKKFVSSVNVDQF